MPRNAREKVRVENILHIKKNQSAEKEAVNLENI